MISIFSLTYCGNFLPVFSIAAANVEEVATSSASILVVLAILKITALMSYLLACCWWDFKSHTLPNRLNYSFLCLAVLLGLVGSVLVAWQPERLASPWYALTPTLGESVVGFLICFSFTFLCWRLGAIGGGDVKLAAVLGAFLGPWGGITALVICHILAMVTVTLDMISRHLKAIRLKQLPTYSQLRDDLKREIPMAGFYAVGVIGCLLGGIAA